MTRKHAREAQQAREDRDLSQEELAAIVGVEQSDISRYETGEREPTPRVAKRLRKTLRAPRLFPNVPDPGEVTVA